MDKFDNNISLHTNGLVPPEASGFYQPTPRSSGNPGSAGYHLGSSSNGSPSSMAHQPGPSNIRRDNSSGKKRARFDSEDGLRHYDIPEQVFDRYAEMEGAHTGQTGAHAQYPVDTSVDLEQVTTLYIPKTKYDDGAKTLMRRRRTSSKRRSSSRRRQERENLDELLSDKDNHLLPSLRLQRRVRTKSLKERRTDLKEEHAGETEHDGLSFRARVQEMKDKDDLTAGHFAELLRDSTLKRMKKIGEITQPKRREKINRWFREISHNFGLWVTSFKVIEGKHGTAVMSYFKFVRWLMLLNVVIMVTLFCVITLPFLALGPRSFEVSLAQNASVFHEQAHNCSQNYEEYHDFLLNKASVFEKVLDFLKGTGWMERTILFVGYYYNKTYTEHDGDIQTYNMGLAYILAVWACYLISFIALVRSSAKTVKATFGLEGSVAAYNNRVFGGWDYAITSAKAAKTKHRNLYKYFKSCLAEEAQQRRREERTANDRATLFFIRFIVWGVVLGVLAGSLFLVYYTTFKLLELQEKEQDLNEIVDLIIQYLPYLTITVLNFAIPLIFQKLVMFEDYTQSVALRVSLFRSIVLRLLSLIVLVGSLYWLLIYKANPGAGSCGNRLWDQVTDDKHGNIKCWETYVGQQIYKLVLLDLVVEASIIVFMQLPRRLLYNRFKDRFRIIKKIGPQDFDLPQSVIDIIYSQTLGWLGMFFSPLIPFMTFLKCIIFFYLRKWTLLKNCAQSDQHYRTSRSQSLFMFVLLPSFVLSFVPFGYIISSIAPSQSCSPFRLYSTEDYTMFAALSNVVRTWPTVLSDILLFIGKPGFILAVIFLLLCCFYYNLLLSQGYKKREKLISEQLKMEGKDKLFLLARVNEVLRHIEAS